MTEDARLARGTSATTTTLSRSSAARERVEGVLEALPVTFRQATDALSAPLTEGHRSCSHIIVASIDPDAAARFDEPEKLMQVREHIGPFPDRRSAERWAEGHYADKHGVAWTTALIRRPAWVEEDVRRLRSTVPPPAD